MTMTKERATQLVEESKALPKASKEASRILNLVQNGKATRLEIIRLEQCAFAGKMKNIRTI